MSTPTLPPGLILAMAKLGQQQNDWAHEKGWWDPGKRKTFGEQLVMFHSEVSEALEEWRNGHTFDEIYYSTDSQGRDKPEGIAVELADLLLRVLDTCHEEGIPLLEALRQKVEYNQGRPYRHGDKPL